MSAPRRRRGGQHIDREARYESTGMTTLERDAEISRLRARGLSQQRIAERLGITQPAVHYALLRLSGKQRNRAIYDACDWCGENVVKGTLDENGCCKDCRDD